MRWQLDQIKWAALLLIIVGVVARLLPHPPNFAPIAALALFGSVYLPKPAGFLIPLGAMLVSDAVIGFYGLTMVYVYGSFLLIGLIGISVRQHKTVATIIGASLLASLLFYLITNFGVWVDLRSGYSPDIDGLWASYAAGLPFFRNTLLGDLVYTGVFFGAYEAGKVLAQRHLPERITRWAF